MGFLVFKKRFFSESRGMCGLRGVLAVFLRC